MDAVQELLDLALSQVGYLEKKSNSNLDDFSVNAGLNNYTKYAKDYDEWGWGNYQAQPWCDMFVSWCFKNAFGDDEVASHNSYCPSHVNWFKGQKRWHTSGPQKGDVIFFKNSSGVAYHVGIVYDVDKTKVYTVEGNTSSAAGVVENGGCVAKKSYSLSSSSIMGYGRPNYEKVQELYAMRDELESLKKQIPVPEKKYNSIEEVPDWAKESTQKRLDLFSDPRALNLNDDMIRAWVLEDRARCQSIDDVARKASYAVQSIQNRIDANVFTDSKKLDLSIDMIRMIVAEDRRQKDLGLLGQDFKPIKPMENKMSATLLLNPPRN